MKKLKPKMFKTNKKITKKDTNLTSKVPISGKILEGIQKEPSGLKEYRKMMENKI